MTVRCKWRMHVEEYRGSLTDDKQTKFCNFSLGRVDLCCTLLVTVHQGPIDRQLWSRQLVDSYVESTATSCPSGIGKYLYGFDGAYWKTHYRQKLTVGSWAVMAVIYYAAMISHRGLIRIFPSISYSFCNNPGANIAWNSNSSWPKRKAFRLEDLPS